MAFLEAVIVSHVDYSALDWNFTPHQNYSISRGFEPRFQASGGDILPVERQGLWIDGHHTPKFSD